MQSLLMKLSVICLLAPLSVALAENKVIGTVDLELDGQQQTWYVLDPGNDTLPGAIWMALGPDKGTVSITAYRSTDIELVRDAKTGSAVPAEPAEVLVFSIEFPVGAGSQSHTLPASPGSGITSIMYLEDWSSPLQSYSMGGDPGQVSLTTIDSRTDGLSEFSGTFSGVFRHAVSGESISVEDGRFRVEGVPFLK